MLVTVGMSERQVVTLLGEPLTKWKPYEHSMFPEKSHYVCYQYSESPSSTNYRLRQIHFSNGKVAEIISYYYLD